MRLTEDQIIDLLPPGDWEIESTIDFARAIEAAVVEQCAKMCESLESDSDAECYGNSFAAELRGQA